MAWLPYAHIAALDTDFALRIDLGENRFVWDRSKRGSSCFHCHLRNLLIHPKQVIIGASTHIIVVILTIHSALLDILFPLHSSRIHLIFFNLISAFFFLKIFPLICSVSDLFYELVCWFPINGGKH